MAVEPDVIVVGAGSAGCVLAARLSEDRCVRVVLLEAGGESRHPLIDMPLTWMQASVTPKFNWGLEAEPDPKRDNRAEAMPRGKLLGGSSAINGTMYIRGSAADYDGWRDSGLAGWGYADVLPYFRRSETNWRGEGPYHGGEGPMHTTPLQQDPAIFPHFADAARDMGYDIIDDFNVANPEGFALPDCSIKAGRRHSTARAFLDPARRRQNLKIETNAHVTRIILEDGRAVGVEFRRSGVVHVVRCRGEVVLAAGALNSPHLLLLSGIGPAGHLKSVGVAPLVDVPGVGRNLQDHPVALSFRNAAEPVTFENKLRVDKLAFAFLQWHFTGRGTMGQSPMSIQGFVRSSADQDRSDLQFQIVHSSYAARPWFPGWRKGVGHQFSTGALLLNPESRGFVELRSPDPMASAKVQLNILDVDNDLRRLRNSLHFTRQFLDTGPAREIVGAEVAPGSQARSDADLDAWLRATVMSGAHQSCTCAMGNGPDAVVDAELRVRGVRGLRVADASVMPRIIRGNTNAPTIMIAEKAADMLLCRKPLPADDPHSHAGGTAA